MFGKKKIPKSQSLAADVTTGPVETPKGSSLSVPPVRPEARVAVPLVTIDADAGYSPEVREAGTAWAKAHREAQKKAEA